METLSPSRVRFAARLADDSVAQAVTHLRQEAYRVATNACMLDHRALAWQSDDRTSAVLCLANPSGQLVSSMRGRRLTAAADLEAQFDIRTAYPLRAPLLALDKATTATAYRRMGLIAVTRFLFLKAAAQGDLQHVAFTVNEGVSRIPFLKKLGFTFHLADTSHRDPKQAVFANDSRVLLGVLDRAGFAAATALAQAELPYRLPQLGLEEAHLETVLQAIQARW